MTVIQIPTPSSLDPQSVPFRANSLPLPPSMSPEEQLKAAKVAYRQNLKKMRAALSAKLNAVARATERAGVPEAWTEGARHPLRTFTVGSFVYEVSLYTSPFRWPWSNTRRHEVDVYIRNPIYHDRPWSWTHHRDESFIAMFPVAMNVLNDVEQQAITTMFRSEKEEEAARLNGKAAALNDLVVKATQSVNI